MEEILFYKMAWHSLKWSYAHVIHFLHFDKIRFNNYTSERASRRPERGSESDRSEEVDNRENSVNINLTKTEKQDIIFSALFKKQKK